jgi:hypothetical protein
MFRIIVKTSGARPNRPDRPPIGALRVKSLALAPSSPLIDLAPNAPAAGGERSG